MTRVTESELVDRIMSLEGTTIYGSRRKEYGVVEKVNQHVNSDIASSPVARASVWIQRETDKRILIDSKHLYEVYLLLQTKGLLTRQDMVKVRGRRLVLERFTGGLTPITQNLLSRSTAIFAILGAALPEQVEVFNRGQDSRAMTRSGIRLRTSG